MSYDAIKFGRELTVGQAVVVAWGYGSGFRAIGKAVISNLNRRTVRVTLTERVLSPHSDDPSQAWPAGQEITVVRPDDVTNKLLHPNNTVHPVEPENLIARVPVRLNQIRALFASPENANLAARYMLCTCGSVRSAVTMTCVRGQYCPASGNREGGSRKHEVKSLAHVVRAESIEK